MKNMILSLIAVAAISLAFNNPIEKQSVSIDTSKSEITWRAYKVLGKHHGPLTLKDGTIDFKGGDIVGGKFTMDMTTIDCDDLSGDSKGKLVGHLKSDDFFSVESHPTSTFVIKSSKTTGKGQYEITGDLTVKGQTHSVTFPATVLKQGDGLVANARMSIDRTKYNVRYGSGKFFDGLGDNMIYDNFDIEVSLVINETVNL